MVLETNCSGGVQSPEQTVREQLQQLRSHCLLGTVSVVNGRTMHGDLHIYVTFLYIHCIQSCDAGIVVPS